MCSSRTGSGTGTRDEEEALSPTHEERAAAWVKAWKALPRGVRASWALTALLSEVAREAEERERERVLGEVAEERSELIFRASVARREALEEAAGKLCDHGDNLCAMMERYPIGSENRSHFSRRASEWYEAEKVIRALAGKEK